MATSPQTVRDLITQLERFDPNAPIRLEIYLEGRGCWTTDFTEIVETPSGSPILLAGVTADRWASRLEEVREKLESMIAKE